VKPKRPTETDLLALVQNGFKDQLPKDREVHAPTPPAPLPKREDPTAKEAPPFEPMVRITLTILEDLRFRLRVALMNHQRKTRAKITQDEFCSRAIAALLEQFEGPPKPPSKEERLAAFLQDCLRENGLSKTWALKAKQLLDGEDEDPRIQEPARKLPEGCESAEQAS
jgi:hypothetical protein